MKLFEALTFYRNVAYIDISRFQIECGNIRDTYYLTRCDSYFKYLDMNVSDVFNSDDDLMLVFKVLIPEIEE